MEANELQSRFNGESGRVHEALHPYYVLCSLIPFDREKDMGLVHEQNRRASLGRWGVEWSPYEGAIDIHVPCIRLMESVKKYNPVLPQGSLRERLGLPSDGWVVSGWVPWGSPGIPWEVL